MSEDANTNLDFGTALAALKSGKRIARNGWNGKGMFLWLNKGGMDGALYGFEPDEAPSFGHPSTIDGVSMGLFECFGRGVTTRLPNINLQSASGSIVTGWLASQTDLLAEDWQILD